VPLRSLSFPALLALAACHGDKADEAPDDTGRDTSADTGADSDTGETDTSETDTGGETDTSATPDGDSFEDAIELEVSGGRASTTDAIERNGDRDFFRVQLTPGDDYVVYTYSTNGRGSPDTVVRVYDSAGAMITEDDDAPYRAGGTDSGLSFRATGDGIYVLEVLDWSDWSGGSPKGRADFVYDLFVADESVFFSGGFPEANEDANNDNDTREQERANMDALAYSWFVDPFTAVFESDALYIFAAGAIDVPDDEDWYAINLYGIDYGIIELSTVPLPANSLLDPAFEVVNGRGEVVARTTTPDLLATGYPGGLWQAGMRYVATDAGAYYLHVRDAAGSGGGDHYYHALANYYGLNPGYASHNSVDPAEESLEDLAGSAMAVTLQAAPETEHVLYKYRYLTGEMEEGDSLDVFQLDEDSGVLTGNFVNLQLATMSMGSGLDGRLEVYDADGVLLAASDANEFREGLVDDPEIRDLYLRADGPIHVVVENVNSTVGATYILFASVTSEALWE
jgi:hypothetical protein